MNFSSQLWFGKNRGKSVKWCVNNDPLWLKWADENIPGFELHVDVVHYLSEIGIYINKGKPKFTKRTKRWSSPSIEKWD